MDFNSFISGVTANIVNQTQPYTISPATVGNAFSDLANLTKTSLDTNTASITGNTAAIAMIQSGITNYALKTDVNNAIATTTFTNVVYNHVRGDAEIAGTNSFNEVANSGITGNGVYETMTTGGTVNQAIIPAYAYSNSVIEVRVYKTTDVTTAPSGWTLMATTVYSAGTFNINTAVQTVVNFATPFDVAVGDQIVIFWNANSGTFATTKYFTGNTTSPARHFFLRANATASNKFNSPWNFSVAGFYAATFKLSYVNNIVSNSINTAVAAQVPITNAAIQTALNAFDVYTTSYTNSRGDTEIGGNNVFADTQRGDGVYEQMTTSGSFNRVTVPFYANADSAVRFRVFKSSTFTTNTALMTLLFSKNFAVGEFNTVRANQSIIDLGVTCSFNTGEYIYILYYDSAGSAPMNLLYWNVDAGSAPLRHPFLRTPAITGSTDPFTTTWLPSATAANFYSATFKLELTQLNLQNRFNNVLSAATGYTASVVSANPNIVLPSKIYAVVGQQMNLYFDNFIYVNEMGVLGFDGWNVTVSCAVGTGYLKFWQITPTSAQTGTYSFTVNVYNSSKNIVASKTISLVIVPGGGISTVKHILLLGDSITQPPYTAQALISNFSTMGGSQPVFHGTQTSGLNEGRGGWKFTDFAGVGPTFYKFIVSGVTTVGLNDQYSHNGRVYQISEINISAGVGYISCIIVSGTVDPTASGTLTRVSANTHDATIAFSSWSVVTGNPLWNASTSKLDIANYRTAVLGMSSGITFDLVSIQLGINDIGQQPTAILTSSQISTIVSSATTLVAAFVADNPTGKVIVNLSPSCNNTGGGIVQSSTYPIYIINMMKLWSALIATFDNGVYNANVIVGFSGGYINRYYGYQLGTIPISNRYSGVTENVHINFVHPATAGYQEIGDATMGQITAMLKP